MTLCLDLILQVSDYLSNNLELKLLNKDIYKNSIINDNSYYWKRKYNNIFETYGITNLSLNNSNNWKLEYLRINNSELIQLLLDTPSTTTKLQINCKLKYFPKEIINFKELTRLEIINNHLNNIPQEINELSKLVYLKLDNNKIKFIDNLNKLSNLEELYLDNNNIEIFPESNLVNLKRFSIENNKIKIFRAGTLSSPNLNYLNLSKNIIKYVSNDIIILKHIEEINLSNNLIEEINFYFCENEKIKKMNLSYNKINKINSLFFYCKSIENIDLSFNNLGVIPKQICLCENLRVLNLSVNCIEKLPKEFYLLGKLNVLNISHNNLKQISSLLSNLNLYKLYIEKNPFVNLNMPAEIYDLQSKIKFDCELKDKNGETPSDKKKIVFMPLLIISFIFIMIGCVLKNNTIIYVGYIPIFYYVLKYGYKYITSILEAGF